MTSALELAGPSESSRSQRVAEATRWLSQWRLRTRPRIHSLRPSGDVRWSASPGVYPPLQHEWNCESFFAPPQLPASAKAGLPYRSPFRPQGSSPSRRLAPRSPSSVCFTRHALMGFGSLVDAHLRDLPRTVASEDERPDCTRAPRGARPTSTGCPPLIEAAPLTHPKMRSRRLPWCLRRGVSRSSPKRRSAATTTLRKGELPPKRVASRALQARRLLERSLPAIDTWPSRASRRRRIRGLRCGCLALGSEPHGVIQRDRKSTRLNSSHTVISYDVF